jgi:hypothetical protein
MAERELFEWDGEKYVPNKGTPGADTIYWSGMRWVPGKNPEGPGALRRGFATGMESVKSIPAVGYAMAQGAMGNEEGAKETLEGVQERTQENLKGGFQTRYKLEDVLKDPSLFGQWALEQTGQAAASIGVGVAGALATGALLPATPAAAVGAVATGAAARFGLGRMAAAAVARGEAAALANAARTGTAITAEQATTQALSQVGRNVAMTGALALSSGAQNIPESFTSIFDETGQIRPGVAFSVGALKASLDVLPITRLLSRTRGADFSDKVTDLVSARLLKNYPGAAGALAGTLEAQAFEGLTEGAQALLDQTAMNILADKSIDWFKILEAGAGAAVGVTPFGAAGGYMGARRRAAAGAPEGARPPSDIDTVRAALGTAEGPVDKAWLDATLGRNLTPQEAIDIWGTLQREGAVQRQGMGFVPTRAEETTTPPETPPETPPAPEGTPPAPPEITPAPESVPPATTEITPAPEGTPLAPPVTPTPEVTPPAPGVTPPAPEITPPAPPAPEVTPPAPEVTPPAPEIVPPEAEATPPALEVAPPTPETQPSAPEVAQGMPRQQKVTTATGRQVDTQYEVVELDSLTAASGDLQPRDRTRATSAEQIAQIAANLDPQRLMASAEADRGAPIVGPDGIVESGNGRVAAIRAAAEQNPQRYAAYVQELKAAGYDVSNLTRPVLIRRRTSELTPEERKKFVYEANQSATMSLSAAERAQADKDALTADMLRAFDADAQGGVLAASNRKFVQGWVAALPQSERNQVVNPDGSLSQEGVRRLQGAMLARAYENASVVERAMEATDDNAKNVTGALIDASPAWAQLRALIESGQVDPAFDITKNLMRAVDMLRTMREKGRTPQEVLAQQDVFDPLDPVTEALFRSFFNKNNAGELTTAAGRPKIAEALRRFVDIASKQTPGGDMFGTTVSPLDAVKRALGDGNQSDLFAAPAKPAAQAPITLEQWATLPAGAGTMRTEKVKQNGALLQDAKALWDKRTSVGQGLKSLLDMLTTGTNRTTKEHAFALSFMGDPSGALTDFFTTNNKGEVRISQNTPLARLLRDSNQSILLVHSHPNNTSFSPGDIESFNNSPGEKISVVRGNNGFVAFMVKPDSLWDKRYVSLSEKATRAANKLAKDLTYRNPGVMQAFSEFKLTREQLFLAYTRLISLGVARLGLIRYTDTAPLSDLDFIPNWRKNLETITKTAAGKEIQNSIFTGVKEAYADGPRYLDEHNRLARSIGEPGGIEGILQGPANVAGRAAQAQRPGGVSRAAPAQARNEPSGTQASLTSGEKPPPLVIPTKAPEAPPAARDVDLAKKKYGYYQDNPALRGTTQGREWIAEKQAMAEKSGFRALAGTITAKFREILTLPTADVATIPGARGERRRRGEGQYDALEKEVSREGWDPSHPIAIDVNHRGEPYIYEGNTRVAVARDKGIPSIQVEIRWLNGGEMAKGNWSPESVLAKVDKQEQQARARENPPVVVPTKAPEGVTKDAENFLKGSAEASRMLDETSIPFSCRVRR